ncbi:MAG: exodeoxyribonuclease VII large subunit, partial [Desulfotomaculaceae bacterium]
IQLLNKLGSVDLIIVGRGGGSLEELWAFNTEIVARSIYNSKIPVISAVGHETDITISDFVADKRAATPSAAAEIAVPDKREMARYAQNLKNRLYRAAGDKLKGCGQRLSTCLANRHFTRPLDVFCGARQQSLDFFLHRLNQGVRSSVGDQERRLAVLAGRLQTLSPLSTLARGYSICTAPDGKRVFYDTDSIKIGERLSVRLYRGLLHCIVEDKKTDN